MLIEQNEKPKSWIKFPEVTVDAWFPVIGCSMEPKIHAGDVIGAARMDSWERIDPDKIYFIITQYDRMIKYLQTDEFDPEILWAVSTNHPRFKIYVGDIVKIYHVVCVRKLV